MKHLPRAIVSIVALSTAISPSVYWFDQFHLGDPDWAPHARAHLIWMWILVTVGASIASFVAIFGWERSADARRFAAGFPCLVWGACLLEAFVVSPAMGVTVPLTHWRMKVFADTEANLFGIAAPFLLAIVGLLLDRRARLARAAR
jgi:hypothetical protein